MANRSDNYPLGNRVFAIKLPVDVENVLASMPANQRVELIRQTLVTAVRDKSGSEV